MGNAIVALIIAALMITSGMAISKTAINSVDNITENWKQTIENGQEISGTDINIVDTGVSPGRVDIYVCNTGRIPLVDYSHWDVLVHYYDTGNLYYISRLDFSEGINPGANEWSVSEIYTDRELTLAEVFQPGILDPGEAARLTLNLMPSPGSGSPAWVVISTEKGITASVQFQN